jgi:hypothetical protein
MFCHADTHSAPPIAQHRKKLGDRENFEQFDRKEPRQAQTLKANARRERRSEDPLSVATIILITISFILFISAAGYLIVANLLPK